MADNEAATTSHDFPTYIDILLSQDVPLDYAVLVGPSKVKFRVDKWMLIARSPQFRRMILDSPLKQDKQLVLEDLDPVAFKHFLIYCYGHDQISILPFTELISMLTIAELYDVPDLKTKLSTTIKPQLNADNVFVALKNAHICDKIKDLWETIIEIIQGETNDIFSNPELRKASKETMLCIVQQDCLTVPEIDVWNAVLDWAKHQGQSGNEKISAENLRTILLPLLKHVRLCTISKAQLVDEVFSTGILNGDEMSLISVAAKEQKQNAQLQTICNSIEERSYPSSVIKIELAPVDTLNNSSVTLKSNCNMKLFSVIFLAKERGSMQGSAYNCEGRITVVNTQTSCQSNTRVFDFVRLVNYGEPFSVRVDNISLLTKNSYRISATLGEGHKLFSNPKIVCAQNQLKLESTKKPFSVRVDKDYYEYSDFYDSDSDDSDSDGEEVFRTSQQYGTRQQHGVYFKTLKFHVLM